MARRSVLFAFIALQVLFAFLYGFLTEYSDDTDTKITDTTSEQVRDIYPMFQDIHVMMFVGFGFLMVFLEKYAFGALGFTFFITAIALQWGILTQGFFEQTFSDHPYKKLAIDISQLVKGDFAAATVLISFGAVIGKTSPLQLIVMTFIEVLFYGLNCGLAVEKIKYADVGGSITIHIFGAFFGLTVSKILTNHSVTARRGYQFAQSSPVSDTFAMIGTLFLWMYWPSFNGALASSNANAQQRCVVNTVFSLCGSTLWTFALSWYYNGGKFNMTDIQNATLAGGVAMGAAAHMRTTVWGALVVGSLGGILSVTGFNFFQGFLRNNFALYDTCGINNLHAMPGLLGGFVSVFFAGIAHEAEYGAGLYAIFPERVTRSAQEQAGYQLYGMAVALGIAIGSGIVTGYILLLIENFDKAQVVFHDVEYWHGDIDNLPASMKKKNLSEMTILPPAITPGNHQHHTHHV